MNSFYFKHQQKQQTFKINLEKHSQPQKQVHLYHNDLIKNSKKNQQMNDSALIVKLSIFNELNIKILSLDINFYI